jgi:hypothetical protein
LARATAVGGKDAIRPARRSTWSWSSAAGRARFNHPQRSAGPGIHVDPSEDDLQRPSDADQAGEALGAGAARDDAERDLHLVEDERLEGPEAQVARGRQLRAPSPDPPCHLADRDLRHRPDELAEPGERSELVTAGGLALHRDRQDDLDVEVGEEEVGVGAAQDDDRDLVVSGEGRQSGTQLRQERERDHVDRRGVDGDPGHPSLHHHVDELELHQQHLPAPRRGTYDLGTPPARRSRTAAVEGHPGGGLRARVAVRSAS